MLLSPIPGLAADIACTQETYPDKAGELAELEDVRIAIRKGTQSAKEMQAWLKQLVGQYTVAGQVDSCGKGNARDQRSVTGKADCIASGSTPNVHCAVNVRWPEEYRAKGSNFVGGASNLVPAELLFSIERPRAPSFLGVGVNGWGLVLLQLGDSGSAEWTSGVLLEDTFIAREPCVDKPGDCQKTTRITVNPDQGISMLVDVHVDRRRVMRQAFQFRRNSIVGGEKRIPEAAP